MLRRPAGTPMVEYRLARSVPHAHSGVCLLYTSYPLWHSTQIENGQNYTGWSNLQADLLMEQGRAVTDPGLRLQLYSEFQKIFADELPALPLFFDVYSYGVSNRVNGVKIGRLNSPWERFRTTDQWYKVTEQVTEGAEGGG